MIIDTQLDVEHLELIKIFIDANELVGIVIRQVPMEYNKRHHMVLQLESTHDLTSEKLTFMGYRHSGVLNMFDDYLLKCGVPHDALKPKSYYRQLQEEQEEEINEDFLEHLQQVVSKTGKINEHLN